MTRRERLERKLEQREEWAEKARTRAGARWAAAGKIADGIPFGQPILVGHHSEKRHRRDVAKINAGSTKAVEEWQKAKHHDEKAAGLTRQLGSSIFADDPDAVQALTERIAEETAKADRESDINKAWRKGKGRLGWAEGLGLRPDTIAAIEETMRQSPYLKGPCFAGHTRANVRRLKLRLEEVTARQARQGRAAAAGVLIEGARYVRITFPEKPDRATLDALKAAGFGWSGGSWHGERERIPAEVQEHGA